MLSPCFLHDAQRQNRTADTRILGIVPGVFVALLLIAHNNIIRFSLEPRKI